MRRRSSGPLAFGCFRSHSSAYLMRVFSAVRLRLVGRGLSGAGMVRLECVTKFGDVAARRHRLAQAGHRPLLLRELHVEVERRLGDLAADHPTANVATPFEEVAGFVQQGVHAGVGVGPVLAGGEEDVPVDGERAGLDAPSHLVGVGVGVDLHVADVVADRPLNVVLSIGLDRASPAESRIEVACERLVDEASVAPRPGSGGRAANPRIRRSTRAANLHRPTVAQERHAAVGNRVGGPLGDVVGGADDVRPRRPPDRLPLRFERGRTHERVELLHLGHPLPHRHEYMADRPTAGDR